MNDNNQNKETDYLITEEGKQYLQGFNDGYLLAEHMPEVVASLDKIKARTPHIEGFLDGVKEYTREKVMEKTKGYFSEPDREVSNDKNDMDRSNRGDREIDLERE